MRYFENRKRGGYLWCEIGRDGWRTAFRAVDDATKPRSGVRTINEIAIEARGRTGY